MPLYWYPEELNTSKAHTIPIRSYKASRTSSRQYMYFYGASEIVSPCKVMVRQSKVCGKTQSKARGNWMKKMIIAYNHRTIRRSKAGITRTRAIDNGYINREWSMSQARNFNLGYSRRSISRAFDWTCKPASSVSLHTWYFYTHSYINNES